jgi:hypothetical protein
MSDMIIEIVNVTISTIPTVKGSYQVADVAYKNKTFQDKLEGKKVMDFVNKEVFKVLKDAKFGDNFDVTRVKNDKGYWDWTALTSSSNGNGMDPVNVPTNQTPIMVKGNPSPKSTYETPEERAARQVLIVRQSSISSAVEFANHLKLKTTEEVIQIAKEFEAFVFGNEVELKELDPFKDFVDDSDLVI